jgi:multidrug transporter EmrE-like cation transporter
MGQKTYRMWCLTKTELIGGAIGPHEGFKQHYQSLPVTVEYPDSAGKHRVKVTCPLCGTSIEREVTVSSQAQRSESERKSAWVFLIMGLIIGSVSLVFGVKSLLTGGATDGWSGVIFGVAAIALVGFIFYGAQAGLGVGTGYKIEFLEGHNWMNKDPSHHGFTTIDL